MRERRENGHDEDCWSRATPRNGRCDASVIGASAMDLSKPVTVLLVESDSFVRDAIVRESTREGLAVRTARTPANARSLMGQGCNRVDVVVLALQLRDGRGESLLPDVEACLRQPAVVITSGVLPDLQPGAFEHRPVIVPKPVSAASLLRSVGTVVDGCEQICRRFAKRYELSKREVQATILLAQGLRAKQIAQEMCCSEKTIYAHLTHVCKKAGCRDSHEVVCMLLAFACRALGHSPPEHAAFADPTPLPPARR